MYRTDLYPYGEANGDLKIPERHDKSKKFILKTGFPVANELEYKIFVSFSQFLSSMCFNQGTTLVHKFNHLLSYFVSLVVPSTIFV